MSDSKKINSQSLGEEISNSVSHGVGALLAVAGTVILIVKAAMGGTAINVVSAALYGASLIILYVFSTLYHSITNFKAKSVLRVFDHCSIYLLILGSYIPISLCLIGGAHGWVLFGINAAAAVVGIVLNSISLVRWKKFSMALYIIMGWSVVMSFKSIILNVDVKGIMLLVAGGVAYTAGIGFFADKKHKYAHFVWHIFVLAGSILQFFFMLNYCVG